MPKTIFAALWVALLPAMAQESPAAKAPPSIRATGEAVISAAPDRARLSIGVATQAATAGAAVEQNAAEASAVLAQLRKLLGPNADIRTQNYSLAPNLRYPREGGQPTITGYTASNTVQITTDNLAGLGKLIDAATQSGANTVQSLQFMVRDERPLRESALREAAAAARADANAMAQALGLRPGPVVSVEEGEPQVVRPMLGVAAMSAQARTPIESGNLEVHARVTVTIAAQ